MSEGDKNQQRNAMIEQQLEKVHAAIVDVIKMLVPFGRAQSLALTKADEALMWALKGALSAPEVKK